MSIGEGQINIDVKRGCDYTSDTFVWTDGDGVLSGTGLPIDLTTASASLVVTSSNSPSATTLLTLVSPTNMALGGTAGTLIITIPRATVDGLAPGVYWYDLLITIGGITKPMQSGNFTVDFTSGF